MDTTAVSYDEHGALTNPPACRCGWIPRTTGPRAIVAVNQHIGRERSKARASKA